MSSPHLESFSIIPEATDDLWPLTQENNSNLVLEPSMFQHSQEDRNIGKELLLENGNVHQKDGNIGLSTCIQGVDQWSLPRGISSCSQPIMDTANGNNYSLDSILVLDQPHHDIDKVLVQKELQYGCHRSVDGGLSSPYYDTDYACSLLQVSRTLSTIEDNARTDELGSGRFVSEPDMVEPNMDQGSWERGLNHPIEDDSDEVLDLLLQESNHTQLLITDDKTIDDHQVTRTDFRLVEPDDQQENSAAAETSNGKGLIGKRVSAAKTRGRNYSFKGLQAGKKMKVQADKGEGSRVKKLEHNAKEKVRRMKLHASYLALGALLPDSCRSKKRKSTRLIIDRAAEYIPELEKEIEKLTLRKKDMLSAIKNKKPAVIGQNPHLQLEDQSLSVHRIRQGEFIVQIFTQGHSDGTAFSNLLRKVEEEEEGMSIMSASTLQVSDDGACCHLHIQCSEGVYAVLNSVPSK
ncbi:hypothetical protein PTKIN_Ptkin10aG0142100 [Pterospermum kingtungense]